jgi:hypothetical protein
MCARRASGGGRPRRAGIASLAPVRSLAAKTAAACVAESYRCHPDGASPTAILVNVPVTPANFDTLAALVTT